MKRVTPKSAGVKLNGKWCFKNQEAIISEEEYSTADDTNPFLFSFILTPFSSLFLL